MLKSVKIGEKYTSMNNWIFELVDFFYDLSPYNRPQYLIYRDGMVAIIFFVVFAVIMAAILAQIIMECPNERK